MSRMIVPTIVMAAIAAVLIVVGALRGGGAHVTGLRSAGSMALQVLPILLLSFIVAGMVQALVPSEAVARWIGPASGMKGIWIGAVAGALTPGGPYVSMPLAAGFLGAGASVGTVVAFLAAWALWSVTRMPLEVGIMGWRFTVVRIACTFFVPPLAGWLASTLFRGANWARITES